MFKLSIFPNPLDSTCQLTADNGYSTQGYADTYQGRPCQSFNIPDTVPNSNGASLLITHQGKTKLMQRGILILNVPGFPYPWAPGQTAALTADDFYLQDSSNFPDNPPSRLDVLSVNMHFRGGQIVDSPMYGRMPWWSAATSWCDVETRRRSYEVARETGDTHIILQIPNGKPLYDEPAPNFYNPSRFPALDWTNGMTRLDSRFSDLFDEIVEARFKVFINMDEVYVNSIQIIRMVMEALQPRQVPWAITLPGYDGVFYGWEPSNTLIPGWARLARSIQPDCMLGLEFNPGHIPLGNGPGDYAIGGLMDGFDCLLGEFPTAPPDPSNLDDCNKIWQVVARMITPYHRPPEQPVNDDPNPPFYLVDSPRGPRTFIAFETNNPYFWVRINPNDANQVAIAQAQIKREGDYFRQLGCPFVS